MTLRYAAVVPSKVIEDYFAALKVLAAQNYLDEPSEKIQPLAILGPKKLLADLVFLLKKRTEGATPAKCRRAIELIRRAEQLGREIARL